MSSIMNNITNYWQQLSTRERCLVGALIFLFVLGLFYWGFLKPLNDRATQAKLNLSAEKELHSWVTESANRISTYRLSDNKNSTNLPLNQLISTSASQYKVSMVRTQPRGESLQVWIQPISFQIMVHWFFALRQKGVYVQMLDIERTQTPGMVEIKRLQFIKP